MYIYIGEGGQEGEEEGRKGQGQGQKDFEERAGGTWSSAVLEESSVSAGKRKHSHKSAL